MTGDRSARPRGLRTRGVLRGRAFAAWLALVGCLQARASADEAVAPAPKTFVYRTVKGLAIEADVFQPPGGRVTPAILWLHGGALLMGMRHNLRSSELERYLAHGYTVVCVDYRLAPETKLPQIVDDIRSAYSWMRSHAADLRLDPHRIAVVGHSAGAYLALLSGVVLRPPPSAIVSYYGYGDILGTWCTQPDSIYLAQPRVPESQADSLVGRAPITHASGATRGPLYTYLRQRGSWTRVVTGLEPRTDKAELRRYCPVANVTPHYPPTMLLHGTADTDVPFAQSAAMRDALTHAQVPCELVELQGKDHGFDFDQRDPDVVAAIDRAQAFLDARLRPERP